MVTIPRDNLTWQNGTGVVLAAIALGVVAGLEGIALAAVVALLVGVVPEPLAFAASQGGALAVLGPDASLLQIGAVEAGLFVVLLGSLHRVGGRQTSGVGVLAFGALAAVALTARTVSSGVLFVGIVAIVGAYVLSPWETLGVLSNE